MKKAIIILTLISSVLFFSCGDPEIDFSGSTYTGYQFPECPCVVDEIQYDSLETFYIVTATSILDSTNSFTFYSNYSYTLYDTIP